MRRIFFFILISISVNAQDKLLDILPLKDGKVYYSKVLEVKGISEEELSKRGKYWLTNYNNRNKNIISSFNDYEQIKSQGFFMELWGPNDYPELYVEVIHTVRFQFRDERYQYEIFNFIIKKSNSEIELEIYNRTNGKKLKYNKLFYKKIDDQIKDIVASLKKTMSTDITIKK